MQAKELGVRSVIIDGPDSWSQTLQQEGIIERFIGLDFSDADTVFERCLEAIKKAQTVCFIPLQTLARHNHTSCTLASSKSRLVLSRNEHCLPGTFALVDCKFARTCNRLQSRTPSLCQHLYLGSSRLL